MYSKICDLGTNALPRTISTHYDGQLIAKTKLEYRRDTDKWRARLRFDKSDGQWQRDIVNAAVHMSSNVVGPVLTGRKREATVQRQQSRPSISKTQKPTNDEMMQSLLQRLSVFAYSHPTVRLPAIQTSQGPVDVPAHVNLSAATLPSNLHFEGHETIRELVKAATKVRDEMYTTQSKRGNQKIRTARTTPDQTEQCSSNSLHKNRSTTKTEKIFR